MHSRDLGLVALAVSFATSTACVVQGGTYDPERTGNGGQIPALLGAPSASDFGIVVAALTPNLYAGGTLNFKVRIENYGPAAGDASVEIELPPEIELTNWTCATLEENGCPFPANGSDPLELGALPVELPAPPEGTVTWTEFIVDGILASDATEEFRITGRLTIEDDPNATNNQHWLDRTPLQSVQLHVTKSDGQAETAGGSSVTYLLKVENFGPSDGPAVSVTDDVSALPFTSVEWDCSGLGGAVCGTEGGAGSVADTGSIPADGSLLYTITGQLDPCFTGLLTNVGEATTEDLDLNGSSPSATDETLVVGEGEACEPDCDCECDDDHGHGHGNGHNGEGHNGNGNGSGPGHSDHDDDGDGDDDHQGNGHHDGDDCDCDCDDGGHDDDDHDGDDDDDDDHHGDDDDDDDHHGDDDDDDDHGECDD